MEIIERSLRSQKMSPRWSRKAICQHGRVPGRNNRQGCMSVLHISEDDLVDDPNAPNSTYMGWVCAVCGMLNACYVKPPVQIRVRERLARIADAAKTPHPDGDRCGAGKTADDAVGCVLEFGHDNPCSNAGPLAPQKTGENAVDTPKTPG